MDALAYSSITNKMVTDAELSTFKNKIKSTTISTGTSEQNKQAMNSLNEILRLTQMKRACCSGKTDINVRIPLPKDQTPSTDETGKLITKFKYYDKTIKIDPSKCGTGDLVGYTKNSAKCDDFYNIYCSNIVKEFTDGNDKKFNDTQFLNYKGECACYIPKPDWLKQAWGGDPLPKCVFPGCGEGSSSYVDPFSRGADCNYTICNQSINMSDIQQGANSSIVANIKAECGGKGGKDPFAAQPVGVTPTPAGPTSTPLPIQPPIVPPVPPVVSPIVPVKPVVNQASVATPETNPNRIYLFGGITGIILCFCFLLMAIVGFVMLRKKKK